ncbi:MAG: CPBP family intramembrane glutamic endopeptidase [Rhodospirillales bacterium]
MPTEAARRGVWIRLTGLALMIFVAGLIYAYFLSIPAALAVPLAFAFALEALFFVAVVWEPPRRLCERRFNRPALAALAAASGILPYLISAVPAGVFRWDGFASVAALAALVSFWFVLFPKKPALNLMFTAVVAAGLLADIFEPLYGQPAPRLKLGILGDMMWTRLAMASVLWVGRFEIKGLGFLPSRGEWAAGLKNFLLFLPAGLLLGWLLDFARFNPKPFAWWQTLGLALATFLGMLWVVALREEFFFRGLLLEWISGWTRSDAAALVIPSLLFGLVHLPFRGFPNWEFALIAAAAGLFYGRAYLQARSIRAAMVTHALVNTTWRVFFPG